MSLSAVRLLSSDCAACLRRTAVAHGRPLFAVRHAGTGPEPAAAADAPTKGKFSESMTYRGGRMATPVNKSGFVHSKYGWSPDLGDFYDTVHFKRIRKVTMLTSLVVFMVYFCVFREENDVDQALDRPLWMSVPAFEVQMLQQKIAIDEAKGKDTSKTRQELEAVNDQFDSLAKAYEGDKATRGVHAHYKTKE